MIRSESNKRPTLGQRVGPMLTNMAQAVARGAAAVRRGVVALDAPTRLARTAEEIRALELDRHAATIARKGGAGARAAAGLARVQAQRAAQAGAPALRHAWSRSAAKLATLRTRPARAAGAIHSKAVMRPVERAQPATRGAPRPLPLFEADGTIPPVPPPPLEPAAPAPAERSSRDGRWAPLIIGAGGVGVGAFAMALYAAQPTAAPAVGDAAFGQAVRAYILDHPDVIPEAVAKLQARETGQAIAAAREPLQKAFSGAWAGNPNGDVVLVEFTDYACGFCRASVRDIERLVAEDKSLKIVFRELPILGPASEEAALVALSAARQGRYQPVHRALFAAGAPNPDKIARVVGASGLDPAKIARDRNDPAVRAEIEGNMQLARAVGLSGTPTFVIGDKVLSGAVGYDALKQAVAAARSAG